MIGFGAVEGLLVSEKLRKQGVLALACRCRQRIRVNDLFMVEEAKRLTAPGRTHEMRKL